MHAPRELPAQRRKPSGMRRVGLLNLTTSLVALATSAVTGSILARGLGTAGRGDVTACLVLPSFLGWFFTFGALEAVSYSRARDPERAPELLTTWLAIAAASSVAAVLVSELIVPLALSAQPRHVIYIARIAAVAVILRPFGDVFDGFVLGDHDFFFYNLLQLSPAVPTLFGYAALLLVHQMTVVGVLIVTLGASLATTAATGVRAWVRVARGRFDRELAASTFLYGLRGHGSTVGRQVTARLDLTIMPAFLGPTSVGLYTVATAASGVFTSLASAASSILLPVATRREGDRASVVLTATYIVLFGGAALALGVALVAPLAVRAIYGAKFADSVTSLRLLLPGAVLFSAANMLWAGLFAFGRPFRVTIAQVIGAVVTVVGLALFLRSTGIDGAACVTTVAYATVFVVSLVLFRRHAGLAWREVRPDLRAISALLADSRKR